MDAIKPGVAETTVTRDLSKLSKPTGNIYESVMIMAKRANQISLDIKQELNSKLKEFSTANDTYEEIFENREQIEISKHYEKMPKPASIAIKEYEDGDLHYQFQNNAKER